MTSSIKLKYQSFCEFMEHNTKGVEIGIYTVSGLLFAVSYYKIRPITKFGKASDIPKRFIREKIIQQGTVKAIEPNLVSGPILRVDHKPPINLFFASDRTVPVKIFGVDLNANGYSWLQSVTVNQKIQFLPLIRNDGADNAECQVKLLQNPQVHQKPSIDLAESLISLGFAKITDSSADRVLDRDEQLKKYKQNLLRIQTRAKHNRAGLWSSIPPPIWPLNVLEKRVKQIVYKKLLPAKHRLPELVR